MRHKLHLPPGEDTSPHTAIVELGVDSLVAVDIKSWFTNELELEVPVLKILGGATVADLVEDAVKQLSAELVPNISQENESVSEQPKSEAASGLIEGSKLSPPVAADLSASSHSSSPPPEVQSSSSVSSPGTSVTTEDDDAIPSMVPKLTYQKTEPMSFGQSRFWFLRQYLTDPTTFNVVLSSRLTGQLRGAKC